MNQVAQKLATHGKRCVHSSIFLPIIALSIFSFVDLPLLSMAQEIEMSTPIVRTFKVAQEVTAPVPAIEATVSTPPPTTVTVTTTEVKPVENFIVNQPVVNGTVPAPATFEPAPKQATTVEQNQIMPVIGKPTSGGETGNVAQPMTETKPVSGDQPQKESGDKVFFNEEEGVEMEFIDPKEVKNALNDIKRMQGDLKRFLKQVKKMPNNAADTATINDLLAQLTTFKKNISAPTEDMSLRDAMQEYWDARMWEEIDKIRAKVELPKELNNVAKDLKKAKKLITQKAFINLGFDMASVGASLAEAESAYNEAKTNYDQGNLEDAQMAMEAVRSGLHPGEIMGVLYQMKEIKDRLKAVRNKEVKEVVNELLAEVIESANSGDFREANQALNDIRMELLKLMQKYQKSAGIFDEKTKAKFDKLEEMIANKLGGEKMMEPKEEVIE